MDLAAGCEPIARGTSSRASAHVAQPVQSVLCWSCCCITLHSLRDYSKPAYTAAQCDVINPASQSKFITRS